MLILLVLISVELKFSATGLLSSASFGCTVFGALLGVFGVSLVSPKPFKKLGYSGATLDVSRGVEGGLIGLLGGILSFYENLEVTICLQMLLMSGLLFTFYCLCCVVF